MGTILGGILIIALGSIVSVVIYPDKFRRKEVGVVKGGRPVEKKRNPFMHQGQY